MSRLVTVAQSPSEAEAQLIKLRLNDAGIVAHLANRQIHTVRDMAGFAAYVWVQVAESDAARARAILATPLPEISVSEEVTLSMEAEAAGRCPECGAAGAELMSDDVGKLSGHCPVCGARWQ